MDKLEFGDGLFQIRDIKSLYTGSRAPRSFPYNETTAIRADGLVVVEYPVFNNMDGNAWSLICLTKAPTQTTNIFGENIKRLGGGMMKSRYAPKPGNEEETRGWLLDDITKLIVKVEQQALDYRLALQRDMAEEAAQKFMDIAQTTIHPFEIYRNLYLISKVLQSPCHGEPGYLPPDIEAECAFEYQKMRKIFLKAREEIGGACDHLNPQLIPIEELKFERIPDSVPGAVYKSHSSLPQKSKQIVPASRTTSAESTHSSEESNLTAVSAWIKETKKKQSSTNKVAPKLASDSSAWFSAATTTSRQHACLASTLKAVAPNTSTSTTVKSSLERISSKITRSAAGMAFDGHVSSASEKTESAVASSPKPRPRPLATNEDFFGPPKPRKVSVVDTPKGSTMQNQASAKIIGGPSVEVKQPHHSSLATGYVSFVPSKPRMESSQIGGIYVEVNNSIMKETSDELSTPLVEAASVARSAEHNDSSVFSPKDPPVVEKETSKKPASIRATSTSSNQNPEKSITAKAVPPKASRASKLANPQDFLAASGPRWYSRADSKEFSNKPASTTHIKKSPAPHLADPEVSFGARNIQAQESQVVLKDITNSNPGNKASSTQNSEKIVGAKAANSKPVSMTRLAEPSEFLAAAKKYQAEDSTVLPAIPSVAKNIAAPIEENRLTEVRKESGVPSIKAVVDDSNPKKYSITSRLASAEDFLAALKNSASSKFPSTVNKPFASGPNTNKSAFGNISVDDTTAGKTFGQKALLDKTPVRDATETAAVTVVSLEAQVSPVLIESAIEKPAVHEPLSIETTSPKEDAIVVSAASAHKNVAVALADTTPTIKFTSAEDFISWMSGGASLKVEISSSPMVVNLTGVSISFPGPSTPAAAPLNKPAILEQLEGKKIKSEPSSPNLPRSENALSVQGASAKSEQTKIKVEDSSAASSTEIYAASPAKPRGIKSPVTEKKDTKPNFFTSSDFDTWISKTNPVVGRVAPPVVQPRSRGASPSTETPGPIPTYITEHAPYYDLLRSPQVWSRDTEQLNPNTKPNSPIVSEVGLEIVTSGDEGQHHRVPSYVKPQRKIDPEAKARFEEWARNISSFKRKKVDIRDEKFSYPPCKNAKYSPSIEYKAHIIAVDQFLDEFDHGKTIPSPDSEPVIVDFNVRNKPCKRSDQWH